MSNKLTVQEEALKEAYVAGVQDTIKYIHEAIITPDIDVSNWSNKPMASLITHFRDQQEKIDDLEHRVLVYNEMLKQQ